MTTAINHWPSYQKRWEFKGNSEEAVIFSGANGGYESRMQYEFMLKQGLCPGHRFLDLGCGALRGTIRLVDYLRPGDFYGADISVGLLKEALMECDRLKLKNIPLLQLMESFDLRTLFEMSFDFILANSLTVHIEPDDIQELFKGISSVLLPSGKLFVSMYPLYDQEPEDYRFDGYRWWYKRPWMVKEAAKAGIILSNMPGKVINRIPGQKKPVISIVNTNMTEWMMEGCLA